MCLATLALELGGQQTWGPLSLAWGDNIHKRGPRSRAPARWANRPRALRGWDKGQGVFERFMKSPGALCGRAVLRPAGAGRAPRHCAGSGGLFTHQRPAVTCAARARITAEPLALSLFSLWINDKAAPPLRRPPPTPHTALHHKNKGHGWSLAVPCSSTAAFFT